ncbi:MAG: M48 family metallopeptidase [Pseudomonadota bacterium]
MTVIRIGARHEAYEGKGLFFDGQTAAARKATLRIDEGEAALSITLPDAETPRLWPLREIRQVRDQAGGDMMVLRPRLQTTERLVLTAPEDQRILRARAPELTRRPPVEGKRRLALWGTGAVAAVAAMIFLLIPFLADNLAGLLPPAGKRALGETVLEDVRVAFNQTGLDPLPLCESPDGTAALDAMGARLFPDPVTEAELTVHVLDHEMVNAFALPGGIVVLMRGLLEAAESADEVAAVYAHEVGHVVARDPSRIALRTVGSTGVLGLLLGDFAGGAAVLFLTNRLIQADYTQEAEAAADAFATRALIAADVAPDALADFFERLRDEYGEAPGVVQYFLSHPSFEDRIAAARAAREDRAFVPVLSEEAWAALESICEDTEGGA